MLFSPHAFITRYLRDYFLTCLILTTATSDQGPLISGCIVFTPNRLDHHGYDIPVLITKGQWSALFADGKKSCCQCAHSAGVSSLAVATDFCSPCVEIDDSGINSSEPLWDVFSYFTVNVRIQVAQLNYTSCFCCASATLENKLLIVFCLLFLSSFFSPLPWPPLILSLSLKESFHVNCGTWVQSILEPVGSENLTLRHSWLFFLRPHRCVWGSKTWRMISWSDGNQLH